MGGSGIRIRIGTRAITNAGDEADLVIAFNEQVLLGRLTAQVRSSQLLITIAVMTGLVLVWYGMQVALRRHVGLRRAGRAVGLHGMRARRTLHRG